MGFTLLIGREEDLCCQLVTQRLKTSGREVMFLPEDKLFPSLQFHWELGDSTTRGSVGFDGKRADIDQITGVLARFSGITTTPEEHHTKDGQYLNSEWHALVRGYVHGLRCPVVNRVRPEFWYKTRLSVLDMLSLAPGLRFRLPKATVTTSFEDARAFFGFCGERIRYSPISLHSDYTIATRDDLEKLQRLSKTMPLFLTEILEGENVRAFVAGRKVVFDWMADDAAAQICLETADSVGLNFCEFELFRSFRGDWYCLGLNSMPYLFHCNEQVRSEVIEGLVAALTPGDRTEPS